VFRFLVRDVFVRTNRRAIAMMLISVCDGCALWWYSAL